MLKNHPKGLIPAALTNMGERFGFYTMMAILVLFLQAKYGLSGDAAGDYYSWFYFSIYALALLGGVIADATRKYKLVIFVGQVIMFAGYVLIAIPNISLMACMMSLFVIAFGNGLFKGNLQAVVGQMYDDEKYSKLRDNAFIMFYMFINVGAFFAPHAASSVRNWWLGVNGFGYSGELPALSHQLIRGELTDVSRYQDLANQVSGTVVTDLDAFALQYLDVFARGYNWAFAIAACAMIVSLAIYLIFNKTIPAVQPKPKAEKKEKKESIFFSKKNMGTIVLTAVIMVSLAVLFQLAGQLTGTGSLNFMLGLVIGLFVSFLVIMFRVSTKEERPRVSALSLVFIVAVFFWMSFHQNGLTLTFFARDYTADHVGPLTYMFFNFGASMTLITTVIGLILAFSRGKVAKRIIGGIVTLAAGTGAVLLFANFSQDVAAGGLLHITPELFQAFNPLFIVALTPVITGLFTYLSNKGSEPSTPRKIGYGMIIAASAYVIMLIGSLDLVAPKLLSSMPDPDAFRVSPYWLLSTYLVLTVAELFISPMGLSFVSKVAPARFQGIMQSGWLLATATGNKLLFVGSLLWDRIDLYMLWGIFIICCILSAIFIFSIMKRLEKATQV